MQTLQLINELSVRFIVLYFTEASQCRWNHILEKFAEACFVFHENLFCCLFLH